MIALVKQIDRGEAADIRKHLSLWLGNKLLMQLAILVGHHYG